MAVYRIDSAIQEAGGMLVVCLEDEKIWICEVGDCARASDWFSQPDSDEFYEYLSSENFRVLREVHIKACTTNGP